MAVRSFEAVYGAAPEVTAEAPGRVNLLGEHTDYNDGFVLPTAIPLFTRVQAARATDRRWRFYADNLGEQVELEDGEAPSNGFAAYVFGCIEVLRRRGERVEPMLMHVASDVPIGAGLSSSAALEIATLRALREYFGLKLDDVALARLAQEAEVEYAGVRCGILDQMACSLAGVDHMLFLDTRTLERRLLPLPSGDLIVIDSGVARTLANSGYNERRAQCEAAARLLGVKALRDVEDVGPLAALPAPLDRRARHVVTENARVLQAARGVSPERFGELMNASHASLRDDYEASTSLLDTIVRLLQEHELVHGARLTGAGFGGACVALAHRGAAERVKADVLEAYSRLGGRGTALL